MTKKLIALMMAVCTVLTVLAGCAQPAAPAPTPEPTAAPTAAPTPEPTPEPAPEPAPAIYTAGTYTASAQGNNGPVAVEVVFSESAIVSVTVTEHAETPGIADTPIERIPAAIVEQQSVAVDSVSGATNTSKAITEAVADCVAQAGGDASSMQSSAEAAVGEAQTINTDVLVIGAGFAGLTAANAALEGGANVLLIEKQAIVGGTSALSGGETFSDGNVANKEEMYNYWIDRAAEFPDNDKLNVPKVRVFIDELYPTLDWLADKFGVQYSTDLKSNPVRRPYGGEGRGAGFVSLLQQGFESAGGTLMLETKATSLMQDASGAVVGAVATAADGGTLTINADSVILATGSYGHNAEMMQKYAAEFAPFPCTAAAGSTGDGMTMAEAVGAVPFEDAAAVNNYAVTADNGDSLNGLVKSSGLYVGQDGVRRSAENEDRYYISTKYLYIPEGTDFYTVYDADVVKQLEIEELFEANLSSADVYKADTLEELAAQMNMNADAFIATVERYNELCEAGVDEDLGKPAEMLLPVKNGPFYAAKNHQVVYSVLGGIHTNNSSQALDADGNVIPGLYAAGDMAARDLYGGLYIGASAIATAFVMGRIAGQHAAAN